MALEAVFNLLFFTAVVGRQKGMIVESERDASVTQICKDVDGVFKPVVSKTVGVVTGQHKRLPQVGGAADPAAA
jgi:hypothetical protein